MGRILREIFAENCMMLEKAALQVKTDFPNRPVWVEGETTALERIFSNLFQNAGRYANQFLNISIQENGTSVRIIFENDTKKITAEEVPYIFDRFYMADVSRNKGGTGLGLTIAKYLAEKMGGSLEAGFIKSEKDETLLLRFTFCLKACVPNNSVSIY